MGRKRKVPDWVRAERWFRRWQTEYISGTSGCLKRLRALASECDDVVEFGVKKGVTSIALLLGARGTVYSYDIVTNKSVRFIQKFMGKKWRFMLQSSLRANIPECDMIFFDSLHTYTQLRRELAKHADKAKKYLVFHDTITFGIQGADGESGEYLPGWEAGVFSPEVHGIRLAIDEFMIYNRRWRIKFHSPHSNGLLCLEHR